MTEVPLLRATDITKSYAGVQALKSASLELRAGEVHALIGENGAGKSTLIKIITGAVEPDGGELQIEDRHGAQGIRLPAGDMLLYPATSLHRVTPVTRGTRLASFLWVQSMVRDDAQRAVLFDLDMAVVQLAQAAPGHSSLVSMTGCYHNLLRMWAEP